MPTSSPVGETAPISEQAVAPNATPDIKQGDTVYVTQKTKTGTTERPIKVDGVSPDGTAYWRDSNGIPIDIPKEKIVRVENGTGQATQSAPIDVSVDTDAKAREWVKSALDRGEEIPADVLKDYPDLLRNGGENTVNAGERGSIPVAALVPDPILKAADTVHTVAADIANAITPSTRSDAARTSATILREKLGERARRSVQIQGDVRASYKKDGVGNLDVPGLATFTDAVEKGNIGSLPPEQRVWATKARTMLDNARVRIQSLGTGKLKEYDENYLPHLWDFGQDVGAVTGRRPLEGSKGWMKERVIPAFSDGLKFRVYDWKGEEPGFKGSFNTEQEALDFSKTIPDSTIGKPLTPMTNNPFEMAAIRSLDMDRYLMAHQFLQDAKARGIARFVPAAGGVPEGWAKINDAIGTVRGPNEGGAIKINGYHVMPEDAARIINNYLSPGLQGNAAYRATRFLGNALNQAQLSMSAFHAMFTSVDAMTSNMALSLKYLASGMPVEAVKKLSGNMFAPITNAIQGARGIKEYKTPGSTNPETARMVDALTKSDARVELDMQYRTNQMEKFFKAWQSGKVGEGILRAPGAALEAASAPDYALACSKAEVWYRNGHGQVRV